MKHYNYYKSLAKGLYDLFKENQPHNQAMAMAINTVVDPIDVNALSHPSINVANKEDLKQRLASELQYEVNINEGIEIGNHHSLSDNSDHIEWYREKVASDTIEFRFWSRYKKYLLDVKGWNEGTVDKLDEVTDDILERIEDPTSLNRAFDRRGLVVGYVQSGKTANFTGVINKAIDSGYKIVIVLSGMHKNLRSQTQIRIDDEVIGRDTSDLALVKRIGVTTLPSETYIPVDTFTTQDDGGDFNRNSQLAVGGIQPGSDRPMLLIVKKNPSVLRNLIRYFRDSTETLEGKYTVRRADGQLIISSLPLLLIDDEADQASVDTRPTVDANGNEVDPTAINRLIRELLNLFNQKAYIGYTATPFANIFMNHETDHSVYNRDLFPSSFIMTIDPPSNYFGPVQVFGLNDDENEQGLPIRIPVFDAAQRDSAFLPLRHRAGDVPDHIPESMKEAIKSFIISSAVRRLRGQENKHNTMLIHCTRFNAVQEAIGAYVEEEFNRLRNGLLDDDDEDIRQELATLWERDYARISASMDCEVHNWNEVVPHLKPAILKMQRRPHLVNGSAGDILDYKNHEATGLSVIAIGGDKLSRGLTLEGLTVSYFTRTSTLYDALMQMGRWFGYRIGYEDLCRLYSTPDLFSWYRHISTAFEILRNEFLEMIKEKSTPMQFGLRVLAHPDMMATSAMKMRNSTILPLTYKGKMTETSTISGEQSILINNFNAVDEFISSLSAYATPPRNDDNYLWLGVPKADILRFLRSYTSFRGAPASNTARIAEFIEHQQKGEESRRNTILDVWNVGLISLNRKDGKGLTEIGGYSVKPLNRSIKEPFENNRLFVKRIISPSDEKLDFEYETDLTAGELRKQEPRLNRPLLLIYPLTITDYKEQGQPDVPLDLTKMPFGFAISWPNNERLLQSTYNINTVYEELELADDE